MLEKTYPYYIANQPRTSDQWAEVTDKYTGKVATKVAVTGPDDLEEAIAAAERATEPMRKMKGYQRQGVLQACVDEFTKSQDDLADSLCIEAGKPIKDARGEVSRLIDTFRIAAEEAVRLPGGGEVMPMDISARTAAYTGMWKRVPIGACSLITPFNFPLNLVAHKVAPALAVGCPFVLKPAMNTPIGALIIGEILAKLDLPEGAFSIVTCSHEHAGPLVEDDRFKLLSFTGSVNVGWDMKKRCGKKPIVLELGGDAAVIVDEDTTGEALDDAVQRIIIGAFYQSGQSCISVQRIIAHEKIYDELKTKLIAATEKLKHGDPHDVDTFIGPVISEREAQKMEDWIAEAKGAGATLLCGGSREGTMVRATLMENVPKTVNLGCGEVFGPVAVLSKFSDFDEALERVNDSQFGLQAGIFTRDLYKMQKAWDTLHVGGVIIGDVPSWRVDHMPYGGVKNSGMGREGIKFAIEDMTEIRLLAIRDRNG